VCGALKEPCAVNVIWHAPEDAVAALVLAHGAGAGMTHKHMQAIADAFGKRGIATLRFDFPFIEAGKSRVDPPDVATASIAAACAAARERTALPIWFGGHSFGGRMASHAVVDRGLEPAGLIFCSFPLHGPGKPAVTRAAHLAAVRRPMLFLSGTRDDLADATLLRGVVDALPYAKVHWLDTADHGYRVLKRSRASSEDVFDEMARVARAFVDAAVDTPSTPLSNTA
jgi:predicted alpha/beta-hydrolase family hydrolase